MFVHRAVEPVTSNSWEYTLASTFPLAFEHTTGKQFPRSHDVAHAIFDFVMTSRFVSPIGPSQIHNTGSPYVEVDVLQSRKFGNLFQRDTKTINIFTQQSLGALCASDSDESSSKGFAVQHLRGKPALPKESVAERQKRHTQFKVHGSTCYDGRMLAFSRGWNRCRRPQSVASALFCGICPPASTLPPSPPSPRI